MQMNQIIFIWLIIHGQDDIFWLVCNGNNTCIFLFQNTADYT